MPEGVQFDEWRPPKSELPKPKMIQWVIRYSGGLIKDEQQAAYVLLGLAGLFFLISFLFTFRSGNNHGYTPSQEEINRALQLPPSLPDDSRNTKL